MKRLALFMALLVLAGCGMAEVLTVTAIQGELHAQDAKAAMGAMHKAGDQMARTNIENAIRTYRAETGANPPTLEALVPNWLPSLPRQSDGTPFYYDPRTGTVSSGPPAALYSPITEADRQNMEMLRQAVNRYGQATRFYPTALSDLVAYGYLPSLPKTSSGKDFLYNPQTGAVSHPDEAFLPSPAFQGARAPGQGAGGAMGEVMTGIGIQNQLNSMGHSGTDAAGNRARASARDIAGQHTQRQADVLRQLDF